VILAFLALPASPARQASLGFPAFQEHPDFPAFQKTIVRMRTNLSWRNSVSRESKVSASA